jgi:putative Mn2+ efflux pump MntP
MPLIGAALGAPLGDAVGGVADYLAAALLSGLGVYMLLDREQIGAEEERLLAMTRRGAAGMLALGVSISLDELAIGFSAGLLRLPILLLSIVVGAQAFLVTQAGIRLGARLGEAVPDLAERLAGAALLLLGAILLVERLA